ncbi:MAG: hypothetical protein U9N14_01600 [Pseudomonadota bacterium]|nr:hypothetical protein [Pseudomonadota bacterium]
MNLPSDSKGPTAREVLDNIARQRALHLPLAIDGPCRIYGLPPDWVTELLAADPHICQVSCPEELDAAFDDPVLASILIVPSQAFTFDLIHEMCRNSGVAKTVFYPLTEDEFATLASGKDF